MVPAVHPQKPPHDVDVTRALRHLSVNDTSGSVVVYGTVALVQGEGDVQARDGPTITQARGVEGGDVRLTAGLPLCAGQQHVGDQLRTPRDGGATLYTKFVQRVGLGHGGVRRLHDTRPALPCRCCGHGSGLVSANGAPRYSSSVALGGGTH